MVLHILAWIQTPFPKLNHADVLIVWKVSSSVIRLNASVTVSSNCGRKTATKKSSRNEVTVDETNEALPHQSLSLKAIRYQFFYSVQKGNCRGKQEYNVEWIRGDQQFMSCCCTIGCLPWSCAWRVCFMSFALEDKAWYGVFEDFVHFFFVGFASWLLIVVESEEDLGYKQNLRLPTFEESFAFRLLNISLSEVAVLCTDEVAWTSFVK